MIMRTPPEDYRHDDDLQPLHPHSLRPRKDSAMPWHGRTEAEFETAKHEQIARLLLWHALREGGVQQ